MTLKFLNSLFTATAILLIVGCSDTNSSPVNEYALGSRWEAQIIGFPLSDIYIFFNDEKKETLRYFDYGESCATAFTFEINDEFLMINGYPHSYTMTDTSFVITYPVFDWKNPDQVVSHFNVRFKTSTSDSLDFVYCP